MALRNQIQKRALSVSRLVAQTPVTTGEVPPEINPMKKWGSFTWTDPFNLESRLTDDEKMFRDAFRFFTPNLRFFTTVDSQINHCLK